MTSQRQSPSPTHSGRTPAFLPMLALLLVAVFPASAHVSTPSNNNGNIHEQKITPLGMSGSGFLIQSYTYDPLNRLDIAAEHTVAPGSIVCPDAGPNTEWCRKFSYDRYGNRSVPAETNAPADLRQPQAFNAATNRVTDADWGYDEAGNVDELDLGGGVTHSMAYDADNRQTAFCTAFGDLGGNCAPVPAAGRTLYHYDAGGNRVKKSGPSGTSIYVYDAFGKLAAEYKDSGTPTPGTFYRTVDHLGSTRLVTDAAGLEVERTDYLPFGEEILVSQNDPRDGPAGYGSSGLLRHKFTGKERDTESGMDYFLARYYSGPMGRFLSVDPIAHPGQSQVGPEVFLREPQRWNKYSYVNNNPLNATDPTGREIRLRSQKVAFGQNHAKIVIIPKNQEKFKGDDRFSKNELSDGRVFATIGAGPERFTPGFFGNLVGAINRPSDVDQSANNFDRELKHPDVASGDQTEDDVIEALFDAESNFDDDSTNYDLFPASDSDGFNSNSFAAGILKAVGFENVPTPPKSPGFSKPVPKDEFEDEEK